MGDLGLQWGSAGDGKEIAGDCWSGWSGWGGWGGRGFAAEDRWGLAAEERWGIAAGGIAICRN